MLPACLQCVPCLTSEKRRLCENLVPIASEPAKQARKCTCCRVKEDIEHFCQNRCSFNGRSSQSHKTHVSDCELQLCQCSASHARHLKRGGVARSARQWPQSMQSRPRSARAAMWRRTLSTSAATAAPLTGATPSAAPVSPTRCRVLNKVVADQMSTFAPCSRASFRASNSGAQR